MGEKVKGEVNRAFCESGPSNNKTQAEKLFRRNAQLEKRNKTCKIS